MPYVYVPSDDETKETAFQNRINSRRNNKKAFKSRNSGAIVKAQPKQDRTAIRKSALNEEAAELFSIYDQLAALDIDQLVGDVDFLNFSLDALQGLIDRLETLLEIASGKGHSKFRARVALYIAQANDLSQELTDVLEASYADVVASDDENIEDIDLADFSESDSEGDCNCDCEDSSSSSSSSDSSSDSESDSESDSDEEIIIEEYEESDGDSDSELYADADSLPVIDVNDESLDSDDVNEFLANVESDDSSSSSDSSSSDSDSDSSSSSDSDSDDEDDGSIVLYAQDSEDENSSSSSESESDDDVIELGPSDDEQIIVYGNTSDESSSESESD